MSSQFAKKFKSSFFLLGYLDRQLYLSIWEVPTFSEYYVDESVFVSAPVSQCSIPATCPNDLGFVDYEHLITVQCSFNQNFLLSAATGTTESWLIFHRSLSYLWPCHYTPLIIIRISQFGCAPSLYLLVYITCGCCWHCHDVVYYMHCRD